MSNDGTQESAVERSADDLLRHLEEIEREVRAARGEKLDRTPWDFRIPSGSDLRHLREECGLTREEVSKRVDYSPDTLMNVENGNTAPGRQQIQTLLRLYKMEWPRHE